MTKLSKAMKNAELVLNGADGLKNMQWNLNRMRQLKFSFKGNKVVANRKHLPKYAHEILQVANAYDDSFHMLTSKGKRDTLNAVRCAKQGIIADYERHISILEALDTDMQNDPNDDDVWADELNADSKRAVNAIE